MRWLDAQQLVEAGLFTSIHAAHRASKRGEIPPPTVFGRRHLWEEGRLRAFLETREGERGRVIRPARKVVVRRTAS
jgi:hypothetical protein